MEVWCDVACGNRGALEFLYFCSRSIQDSRLEYIFLSRAKEFVNFVWFIVSVSVTFFVIIVSLHSPKWIIVSGGKWIIVSGVARIFPFHMEHQSAIRCGIYYHRSIWTAKAVARLSRTCFEP
ncbi:unnamed protein product [Vicia faba]|uniref:Transmembrane protein n=1 Tax=Vicia faba TaxID=3906 RepID=A0AAV1AL56_VICFA|nr:unnamed protein product [Vicia faba]